MSMSDSAGDRDTLTDAEIEHIQAAIMRTDDPWYALEKAVESIVAARVRAACEKAWDEGWNECVDHRDCTFSGPGACPDAPPNPYRTAKDAGATKQGSTEVH